MMQGKHFHSRGRIQHLSRNTGRRFVGRGLRRFETLEERRLLAGDSCSLDQHWLVGECGAALVANFNPTALALPGDAPGGGGVAPGEFAPTGVEFLANTFTNNHQRQAAVAMDGAGNYVIVWQSLNQDEERNGVYAQRYFADGSPNGLEFLANTRTADAQENPAVAMNANGEFVITWQSLNQDGNGWGIYAQRYSAAGAAVGGEIPVNTTTDLNQQFPSVAMADDGSFVVAWEGLNADGSGWGIVAQRFDSGGNPSGGEVAVNTTIDLDQTRPSVAMTSAGDFVITWQSINQDGSGWGIYARQFDASGNPTTGEIPVNSRTDEHQQFPSVAIDDSGSFSVAWQSVNQDGGGWGIYRQSFDSAGSAVGGEMLVNTFTTGDQTSPAIAMTDDGGHVVVWQSLDQDGSNWGVYLQQFDSAGSPIGAERLVNTRIANHQMQPAVAASGMGQRIVAWESFFDDDGSEWNIYGQRFAAATNAPPIADAGGPYTIDAGAGLTLDGTGSSDDEIIVAYHWDLDNDGVFDDAEGATSFVSWAQLEALGYRAGMFSIGLRVTDDGGLSATATSSVTVYDNRPFARLVINPSPALCEQPVAFDARTSSHGRPDRSIVSYNWTFGDGESYTETLGNAPDGLFDGRTSHVYHRIGDYSVALVVSDDNVPERTSLTAATLQVTIANTPPVAKPGGPYDVRVGEFVALDASSSFDPDAACGDVIVAYEWDLDNDGVITNPIMNPTGVVVTPFGEAPRDVMTFDSVLTYKNENWNFGGEQQIKLRVIDSFGAPSDPYAGTVIRIQSNQPPVAEAGGPHVVEAGHELILDAAGSFDPDGDPIVLAEWDLDNDGVFDPPSRVEGTRYVFVWNSYRDLGVGGPHTVVLRVTDSNGGTDTDTTSLTILDTTPPVLTLPPDQTFEATSPAGAVVVFADATATDVVSAPTIAYSPANGSQLALGETIVQVTATDSAGNGTTGFFKVFVIDTTAPETEIVSAPATLTNSSTAHFEFAFSDSVSDVEQFEYSIDSQPFEPVIGSSREFTGLDDGPHTLRVRAIDAAGNVDQTPAEFTWIVDTVGPVISIHRATASAANAFGWNNSDVTVEYVASDAVGLASPATGSFTFTTEGENQSHTFTVTDLAGNETSISIDDVNIDKTPPVAAILPASGTYLPGTHFSWDSGDGLAGLASTRMVVGGVTSVVGSAGLRMMTPGTQAVELVVTDFADNTATVARSYTVTGVAKVGNDVVVVGTEGHDTIFVIPVGLGVRVWTNGVPSGIVRPTAGVGKIIVHALDGHDRVEGGSVRQGMRMYGGRGNDRLVGGWGNDAVFGGDGADQVAGGFGRDLIVGGAGGDTVSGAGAILIHGRTAYDDDAAAVDAILATWGDPLLTYTQRISRLQAGVAGGVRLDGTTVFDDGASDLLIGRAGLDWMFAELGLDRVVLPFSRPRVNQPR